MVPISVGGTYFAGFLDALGFTSQNAGVQSAGAEKGTIQIEEISKIGPVPQNRT